MAAMGVRHESSGLWSFPFHCMILRYRYVQNCLHICRPYGLASHLRPVAHCVVVCVVTQPSLPGSGDIIRWRSLSLVERETLANPRQCWCSVSFPLPPYRLVFLGSLNSGPGGRRFESSLPDHKHNLMNRLRVGVRVNKLSWRPGIQLASSDR
jgi:hypothetical protein